MTRELSLPFNASVGSIDSYMSAIAKLPRLEVEAERALAQRFRESGDLDAARELVLANLRFVAHVARGYMGYGLALPDLIQEGNIGLMKAVKRFDPDMGVRLVSFAVHWIKAEIHEYIIQNWRIVKVATTKAQRKLFFNLRKFKTRLGWFSQDEASAVAEDGFLHSPCRLCLNDENAAGDPLLHPCKCTGSLKYIHLSCIQDWIRTQVTMKELGGRPCGFSWKPVMCEICHTPLPVILTVDGQSYDLFGVECMSLGAYIVAEETHEATQETMFHVAAFNEQGILSIVLFP